MDLGELDVVALHDGALARWYADGYGPGAGPERVEAGDTAASVAAAQHHANFRLWNLEDEARRRDVGDDYIADIKRRIDRTNQLRNDLVERLDEALLASLAGVDAAAGEQHSETAGMIIDRLSILALKIHHMRRNAARRDDTELAAQCADRLAVLEAQRADLIRCLEKLLADCRAGRRYFKLYRQFKAYNDPRLNPAVSGGSGKGGG